MNYDLNHFSVYDKLPIGIFILRLEDRDTLEFRNIYVNQTNSEIVGVDLKEFEGQTLRESFPSAYDHGLPNKYLEALDSQKPVKIGEMQYGDDKVKAQTWYLEVIPVDENTVMLTTENVSELKKTRRELTEKNNILKSKNQELEQFTYITSHDLQEPLRTINSMSELLKENLSEQLSDQSEQMLNFLTEASSRMQQLIRDLLDYSRLGKEPSRSDVDLNQLVENVKSDLNSSVEKLQAHISTSSLPTVHGHPTELRLLLQNLIANALKFHKPETTPSISISGKKEENHWLIKVSDNGIGIAADHQERIFMIFQRLHPKEKYEGSGIGLAHCKKIIDHHGGRIWVESTVGKGSTFYFTLPAN